MKTSLAMSTSVFAVTTVPRPMQRKGALHVMSFTKLSSLPGEALDFQNQ